MGQVRPVTDTRIWPCVRCEDEHEDLPAPIAHLAEDHAQLTTVRPKPPSIDSLEALRHQLAIAEPPDTAVLLTLIEKELHS